MSNNLFKLISQEIMKMIKLAKEENDSKNKNAEGSCILIVAGCMIAYTPVVNAYISYARENKTQVDVVEYKNFKRISFIVAALEKIFKKKYKKIVCINNQSLPILFICSWMFSKQLVYWKLESNKPFEDWSLALKLQLLEYLLNRKVVSLIVPTPQREQIQVPKFESTYILPNAPVRPFINSEIAREFCPENINLVLYGSINNDDDVYLNEWVIYCEKSKNCNLTVIGKIKQNTPKVSWYRKLRHELLINQLIDPEKFNFSIVGYHGKSLNNIYAAPNKLLESLSCGLPIIGHLGNPYVANLIGQYQCGLLADFSSLDMFVLNLTHEQYFNMVINALRAASFLCLSRSVYDTPLWFR